MTKESLKVTEIDESGAVVERDMTQEEIAQKLADREAIAAREAEIAAASAAKAALLERLGITADEAKLLLA